MEEGKEKDLVTEDSIHGEDQLEHFLEKDFLKLILKNKVCQEKPYLSNEDIGFFRINVGSEVVFL